MKLLGDQTTLVLAGAWNPAILRPDWIGRHILELPPGKTFQVGMLLPVQDQSGAPRLSFEGLSITPAKDALIFHLIPEDTATVAKSVDAAKRILEMLPHTPIAAMGVNFAYQVDPLQNQLSKTVDWADSVSDLLVDAPEATVVNRQWQVGINAMGHMINVCFRADAQGATIKVNHHYEVEGSAAKASAYLTAVNFFEQLLGVTNKLVEGLTGGGA